MIKDAGTPFPETSAIATRSAFVDRDVIIVIATDLPSRDVDSADLVTVDLRRARRQEDPLDLVGDLKILVEALLFGASEKINAL